MNRRALAICGLGICGLSIALGAGAADDTGSRLRELQQAIVAGERRAEQTGAARREQERALQREEIALAELRKREAQLAADIAAAKRHLQQIESRRTDVEATRQRQLRRLADDVAVAYRLGHSEPFKVLLNQEDPLAAERMLRYYGYFAAARGEQLAGYREAAAELKALEAAAAAERSRLHANQEQLANEQARMRAGVQKRQQLVAALAVQLGDERVRLRQQHAEAKRLQRLLDELASAPASPPAASPPVGAGKGPFARRAGQLPWPVNGQLLHRYGASRADTLRWNGWLLAVAEGAPVHAVHAGTVVFADYLRGYGQLIILDHGHDYLTLYAHNQQLLKLAGNPVTGGEAVARAGNSGGQRDSALYFEIRRGGKPLDPAHWLRSQP